MKPLPVRWTQGMSANARWYNSQLENGSVDVGVSYDGTGKDKVLGGDVIYDTALFGTDFFVDHTFADTGADYTSYNGRFNTSFAVNTQSAGIGGNIISNSAVMVDISGDSKNDFDVLVNNAPVSFALGGTTTVVPLPPFDTYDIAIRPRGDGLHDYDTTTRTVTLYPGNVETIDFSSREALVLLGKLVNEEGEALAGHQLSGSGQITRTDEFGLFQIRVPKGLQQLQVNMANGESCQLTLPEEHKVRAGISLLGSVSCEL